MSLPSKKYFDLVERWILGGVPIEKMSMSADRRFRAMLVFEAYQVWVQDKQIRPSDVLRRIAAREYSHILHKAADGDEKAAEYVSAMNIRAGVPRTVTEISNDVALLNFLIGRFSAPVENIERMKVIDASDWLMRQGMKTGDSRSVKAGADLKMTLYDDFKSKDSFADQLPSLDINITGDVSVVKRDRINYTEEEKNRLARKYGLTRQQAVELFQQPDGTWQMQDEETEGELEKDVYAEDS